MEIADIKVEVYNIFKVNARLGWVVPKEGMGIDPFNTREDRLKDIP